jgi:antitoxin VapB
MEDPWQTLEAGLAAFEPGFQLSREQPEQQQRQELAP